MHKKFKDSNHGGYAVAMKNQIKDSEKDIRNEQLSGNIKILICILTTIPLLVLEIIMHFESIKDNYTLIKNDEVIVIISMLQLIITIPIVVLVLPYYKKNFKKAIAFQVDLESISLFGMLVLFLYSSVATVLIVSGNHELLDYSIPPLYYGTYAFASVLFLWAKEATKLEDNQLSIHAQYSNLLKFDNLILVESKFQRFVNINELKKGDIIIVKPGQTIPADGIIIEGSSHINEYCITGNNFSTRKEVGENVYCGTINKSAEIKVLVSKQLEKTEFFKLIKNVITARETKMHEFINTKKIASNYSIIYAFISVAALVILITNTTMNSYFDKFAMLAVILYIASIPISHLIGPLSFEVAVAKAKSYKLKIYSTYAALRAKNTDILVFDKTGTVTEGEVKVSEVIPFGVSQKDVLAVAYGAEKNIKHPIAQAIINYCKKTGAKPLKCTDHEIYQHKGLKCKQNGVIIGIGNKNLADILGATVNQNIIRIVEKLENSGRDVVFVIKNKVVIGVIGLSDEIKKEAPKLISQLKALGKEVWLVSGDKHAITNSIAKKLGINEKNVISEVLPEQKVELVRKFQKNKKLVMFIGDGLNDAAAIAQSDVGVALASGTDIAKQVCDILIENENIYEGVLGILKISSTASNKIKENAITVIFITAAILGYLAAIFSSLSLGLNGIQLNTITGAFALLILINSFFEWKEID